MTYIPRVTPEAVGLSSRCILRMLDRLAEKQVDLTSILLLRQDKVLFEAYWTPYDPAQLRTVYSMSKTFTALAVGDGGGGWRAALGGSGGRPVPGAGTACAPKS